MSKLFHTGFLFTLGTLMLLTNLLSACQGDETVAGNYKRNYVGEGAAAEPEAGGSESGSSADQQGDAGGDEATNGDEDPDNPGDPADAPAAGLQGDATAGVAFLTENSCAVANCHAAGASFQAVEGRLLHPDTDTEAKLAQVFTNVANLPFHTALPSDATNQVNIWQAASDGVVPDAAALQ